MGRHLALARDRVERFGAREPQDRLGLPLDVTGVRAVNPRESKFAFHETFRTTAHRGIPLTYKNPGWHRATQVSPICAEPNE